MSCEFGVADVVSINQSIRGCGVYVCVVLYVRGCSVCLGVIRHVMVFSLSYYSKIKHDHIHMRICIVHIRCEGRLNENCAESCGCEPCQSINQRSSQSHTARHHHDRGQRAANPASRSDAGFGGCERIATEPLVCETRSFSTPFICGAARVARMHSRRTTLRGGGRSARQWGVNNTDGVGVLTLTALFLLGSTPTPNPVSTPRL